MKPAIQDLIHPKVKQLTPYLPGKSIQEIQEKHHLTDVIKLASNENAWGCSPKVLEKIQKTTMDDIRIYPNTYLHPFFKSLYHFLDIPAENLFLTNGSDAIFSLLIQAYAYPTQKQILTHQYAFMGYETQAHAYGLNCLKIPVCKETWQFNLDELIDESKKDVAIIFIANPNNPTGTKISWHEIEYLLQHIPQHTLLVIDEAYYEYDVISKSPKLDSLLASYANLIITRTFSKAYGLASLRLGYAMAHSEIIKTLKKIQLPFTISQITLNACEAAIHDQKFIQYCMTQASIEKEFLTQEIKKLPLILHSGHGNFISIELPTDIMPLVTYLESQGIIIRPLHAFGLKNCARITIGQHTQNEYLIQTLKKYLK
jgi:histidinol-phosphate aminotransferase